VSWNDEVSVPSGHQMTLKEALQIVSSDMAVKLIVPGWAMVFSTETLYIGNIFIFLLAGHEVHVT
jgi:hypothetical protein